MQVILLRLWISLLSSVYVAMYINLLCILFHTTFEEYYRYPIHGKVRVSQSTWNMMLFFRNSSPHELDMVLLASSPPEHSQRPNFRRVSWSHQRAQTDEAVGAEDVSRKSLLRGKWWLWSEPASANRLMELLPSGTDLSIISD